MKRHAVDKDTKKQRARAYLDSVFIGPVKQVLIISHRALASRAARAAPCVIANERLLF